MNLFLEYARIERKFMISRAARSQSLNTDDLVSKFITGWIFKFTVTSDKMDITQTLTVITAAVFSLPLVVPDREYMKGYSYVLLRPEACQGTGILEFVQEY
jgi:Mlc titration factor MtfA (ptsG expression regulator)